MYLEIVIALESRPFSRNALFPVFPEPISSRSRARFRAKRSAGSSDDDFAADLHSRGVALKLKSTT